MSNEMIIREYETVSSINESVILVSSTRKNRRRFSGTPKSRLSMPGHVQFDSIYSIDSSDPSSQSNETCKIGSQLSFATVGKPIEESNDNETKSTSCSTRYSDYP